MIIGKTPTERAKEIAQENSIELIEHEIEEWAKRCNELNIKLEQINNELSLANSKRILWCWAKEEKLR